MSEPIDKCISLISDEIKDFSDNVQERIIEELNHAADEILDYIKSNAPRGKSKEHLADSFIKTEVGEGANKVIYISSKTKSHIVHFVELGYKHKSGKHVPARPFLRPAYDNFTPEMLEQIRKIMSGG